MSKGVGYKEDGRLEDDAGHVWRRVSGWVEPSDADRLVAAGVPFLIQWCGDDEILRGRPERYPRDVRRRMLTRAEARQYEKKASVPSVLVAELWRSQKAGDLLLFVANAPLPRHPDEF